MVLLRKSKEDGEGKEGILEKLVPILLLASIGLAFLVGVLWQRVSLLEKGGGNLNANVVADQAVAGANNLPSSPDQKLTEDQVKKIPAVNNNDHIMGSKDAKVVLIEYSDFECPFCERFHPTVKQALQEYGNDVALVYRHFPLEQIHPQARPAAEASECVASLGGNDAFWKFVDAVFANQAGTINNLSETAVKAGVNKARFDDCVAKSQFKSRVDEMLQGATAAGITGTPGTFVLNKKGDAWLIAGALPYASVKAVVDEALKN